ncbi:MAG: hypothetical protein J6U64_00680 [Alphaproteobacteria bacterium]|nr:hypothetical protein [Alphaproteobacteria bacterium]
MMKKDFKKKVLCGTCFVLALLTTDAFAKSTAVVNPTPSRTSVHAEEITDRTYLDNIEAALDIHNFVQSRINPRLTEHDSTKNAKVDNALNEKRSETCDTCNQALLDPYMSNADEVWAKLKELSEAGHERVVAKERENTELSTDVTDYLGVWDMGHEVLMTLYKDMDNFENKLPKRIHYSFKLWEEQKKLYDDLEWNPKYTKINQDIAAEIGTSCITVASDRHVNGEKKIVYPEYNTEYYSGAHYDYYHHDGEFMTAHNNYLTAIETEYNEKWKSVREAYLESVYNATYAQVKAELEGKTCTRTVSCPGGSCCSSSGSESTEQTSCTETYSCPDPDASSKAETAAREARNKADTDGSADAAANKKCPLYEYKVPEKMRTDEKVYVPIEQPRPLPPLEETVMCVNGDLYPQDPVLWTYKGTDYKWSGQGGSCSKAGELQNNRLSRYVMVQEEQQMSEELLELHQATDLLTIAETINMARDYGINLNDEKGNPILKVEDDLFLINNKSCGVENDTDPSKNEESDKTPVTSVDCEREGECDTLGQEEDVEEDEGAGKCNTEEEQKIAFDYDEFADVRFNTDQFDKMTELNKENLTEVKARFLNAKASQIADAKDKIEFFHMDEHTPGEVAEARQIMAALEQDASAKTLLTFTNSAEPLNYTYTYENQEIESVYGKDLEKEEQKVEFNSAFEQYEDLTKGLSEAINEHRKQLKDTWEERMGPMDSDCLQEGIDGNFPEGEQAIADLNREIKD